MVAKIVRLTSRFHDTQSLTFIKARPGELLKCPMDFSCDVETISSIGDETAEPALEAIRGD
jgi:hypothetical protein